MDIQTLEEYRDEKKKGEVISGISTWNGWKEPKSDWQACYLGCRKDIFPRFTGSCTWPVSIFSRLMPSVVLWLNPVNEE